MDRWLPLASGWRRDLGAVVFPAWFGGGAILLVITGLLVSGPDFLVNPARPVPPWYAVLSLLWLVGSAGAMVLSLLS